MYHKDFSSTAVEIVRLLEKENTQERDKVALITLLLRTTYNDGWKDSHQAHFDKNREFLS